MDLAALSLAALVLAIIISSTTRVNVGFLAISLAWIVGVYIGDMSTREIISGFPTSLFLTLAGVTLLFTQAQVNGTLEKVAHRAVLGCRGNAGVIPIMFFFLAASLASIGPGNIAAAALLAPMAMVVAGQVGIPAFLMAIMVGNGANAGSLSPIAPTGIIVNGVMANAGLVGFEWHNYFNNLIAHTAVAFTGYFLLGGWRLFKRSSSDTPISENSTTPGTEAPSVSQASQPFESRHIVTLGVIGALVIGVIFFKVHVGMGAFTGAVLLTMLKLADEVDAVRNMPWRVIMLVCGVTVLIGLMSRTGGLDLFTSYLARFSSQGTVTGVVAFFTGIISIYSSTSGVVLPAFLPTIPGLIEQQGGGDALAIASAMNVGGHLVDVSPLSTIGALCLASAPVTEDSRALFNKLMIWGLSMSVVGGLACWLFFGLLW